MFNCFFYSTAAEPLSNRNEIDRSSAVEDLIEFPVEILTFGAHVAGLPFKIPPKLLKFATDLIVAIENFSFNRASDILKLFNEAGNALLDGLVAAGVLGGKTAEDVITFITETAMKIVKTIWNAWTKAANFIVDHLLQVIKKFRSVKDLIEYIAKLPIIKNIIQIITPVKTFVYDTLKNQSQLVVELIHSQVEKHSDFFEPILNGTATRILVISNALQALVDGNLEECAGNVFLGSSPTGSLTWKVNLLIDKFKVILLKLLGLSKLADGLEIATNAGKKLLFFVYI